MFKLNIHSIVDVITNSSTVIYTYQNGVKEAKELLQEILNIIGEKKEVDDLFSIGVFASDNDIYTEYLSELVEDGDDEYPDNYPSDDWKAQDNYIVELKETILKEEVKKPEWMKEAESKENYDGYTAETSLYISPKDEKYTLLIEKMMSFLNSPAHEAFRDG